MKTMRKSNQETETECETETETEIPNGEIQA